MVKIINPRASANFVSLAAKNVVIMEKGISRVGLEIYYALRRLHYLPELWREHHLHPNEPSEFAINWIFLVNSINFCFWSERGNELAVTYKNEEYTRYWMIPAIINRALDQGIPMCSPEYYGHLNITLVKKLFAAHKKGKPNEPMELPMLEERLEIMRFNGQLLYKKFGNTFVSFVVKAKKSAMALLQMIVDHFPSFRDEAKYLGHKLGFYKRAQLVVGDIYACYEGEDLGEFYDIAELTMFVDHRIVQCLFYLRVLRYRRELNNRIRSGEEFPYGDTDEIEMRALAMHSVELIRDEVFRIADSPFRGMPQRLTAIVLDFYLWDVQRTSHQEMDDYFPAHKCRTIHY